MFLKFQAVDSDSCNMENDLDITVLYCLTSFHWT